MVRWSAFATGRRLLPRVLVSGLLLFALMVCGQLCEADEAADRNVEVVEVRGSGVDVENAKRDACREAVRQVVGAYVTAKTRTENDELIEDKVVSLSSGFVEKWEPLQESSSDGLVRVKARVTVRISKVVESLKEHKISVKEVDGESLGARLLTTTDQRKGTRALIEEAMDGFPAHWFTVSVEGDPRLGQRSEDGTVSVITTVVIEPNIEAFTSSAVKLDEALKATDRAHGEFEVDSTSKRFIDYPTQAELDRHLGWLLAGEGANRPFAATVLVGIDGRGLFPREISYFNSRAGVGNERVIVPNGVPLLFPTKFTAGGKRSTWKWYGVTLDEARDIFARWYNQELACHTSLVGKDGEETAVKVVRLRNIGIGGMQYFKPDELYRMGKSPIAIAPAVISRNNVHFLIPKFSCEVEFVLEESEVRGLTKIVAELK